MPYEGPERRSADRDDKSYKIDEQVITGASARTARERISVDKAGYTEGDEMRDRLKIYTSILFNLPEKRFGEAEGEKPADDDTASKKEENTQEALETKAIERYKAEYDRLPEERSKLCSWEKVLSRLGKLGKDDKPYLTLAMDLTGGGELVDIDDQGNPLFTHVGGEAYMLKANYKTAREAVYGKDYNPKTHRGYEMANIDNKGAEIRRIEAHTGRAFVHDPENKEYRESWLESGEEGYVDGTCARFAQSRPSARYAFLHDITDSGLEDGVMGVVRLLRVLE